MADVIEIYALTGETVERDFTPEELAQRETDAANAAIALAEAEAKAAADAAVRADAIDHAKTLGFTDEMIAVMYPNLASAL